MNKKIKTKLCIINIVKYIMIGSIWLLYPNVDYSCVIKDDEADSSSSIRSTDEPGDWTRHGFTKTCTEQTHVVIPGQSDTKENTQLNSLIALARDNVIDIRALLWHPKRNCPYCRNFDRFVRDLGQILPKPLTVKYTYCTFEEKPEYIRQRTLPQIWVGSSYVGGWSDFQTRFLN